MVRDQRIHFIYSMNTKKPQVISVYENKFKKRSHITLFKINQEMKEEKLYQTNLLLLATQPTCWGTTKGALLEV